MDGVKNEEVFGQGGHLVDDYSDDNEEDSQVQNEELTNGTSNQSNSEEQREQRSPSCSSTSSNGDLLCKVNVKYLGKSPTLGIWGLEFTRKATDELLALARARKYTYPAVLEIFNHGVKITYSPKNDRGRGSKTYIPIHKISYGVQDSVYTHIFSMIVVRDEANGKDSLFECRCFICNNAEGVVDVTRALSKAFRQQCKSASAVVDKDTNRETAAIIKDTAEEEEETELVLEDTKEENGLDLTDADEDVSDDYEMKHFFISDEPYEAISEV